MSKFRIVPHGRLQEWVAEEKGYFADEGLDYEFVGSNRPDESLNPSVNSAEEAPMEIKRGTFESMESGRACEISSACHWAVGMAASAAHGRMWGKFWKQGHDLVIYQDPTQGGNIKPETILRKVQEIRAASDDAAEVVPFRWSIGSSRMFFAIIQPKRKRSILDRINRLPNDVRSSCFGRVRQNDANGDARC